MLDEFEDVLYDRLQVVVQQEGKPVNAYAYVIEEYRVNGHLYMVKITPTVGPAYYLVDDNGNGELDTRRSSLDDTNIPRWVLLRW